MSLRNIVCSFAFLCSLIAVGAHAQANPAASRTLGISAFGGLTGTYTGLSGGRNLGITAGADVGFRPFFRLFPSVEVRGTYPVDGGQIDAQRDVLGGLRVSKPLPHHLSVYGDLLTGRGQIDYQNGGYPNATYTYLYVRSISNVFSPGGGVEWHVTDNWSAFADAQFQHWNTPATASGSLWSKPITVGVRYTFNFNRHGYPVK